MGLLPKFAAQETLSLHCPLCSFHSHWTEKIESHFVKKHIGRTAEFSLYQCSLCNKIASSRTFIIEHLELEHKANVQEIPASPCSDSDAVTKHEDGEEGKYIFRRPGSTPGTHLDSPKGRAIPIFSGTLQGGDSPDGAFEHQCLFCEFSTGVRDVLTNHYAHHGIKNLQAPGGPEEDMEQPQEEEEEASIASYVEKAVDNDADHHPYSKIHEPPATMVSDVFVNYSIVSSGS